MTAEPLSTAATAFRAMGFREADVANVVSEAYLPMAIDSVTVGLRGGTASLPTPVFVRPQLKEHLRALRHLDIPTTFAHVADDEFHRVGIEDPNGLPILLIEARTHSPLAADAPGIVGEFLELSVPTHSIEASVAFWHRLGFVDDPGDTPDEAHHRLCGHGLSIGFHAGVRFAAGLTFTGENLDGRVAYLRAKGCTVTPGTPIVHEVRASATLQVPGAGPLYLLERP